LHAQTLPCAISCRLNQFSRPTLLPDSTLLDSSKMRLDMLVSTEGPTNMSSCLLQERQNTITSGQLSEAGSYHKLVRNETEKRNLAHQTATPQSTCNQQRNVSSTVMTICLNAITQPCARYIHSAWVGVSCRQQPQSIQDALASKPQKEMPVALYLPSMRTITALGRETEEQQELTLGEIPDSNSWTRATTRWPTNTTTSLSRTLSARKLRVRDRLRLRHHLYRPANHSSGSIGASLAT
ncbi:hypothetical protein KCU87_g500, partial [Aureobasidium melanogenum]